MDATHKLTIITTTRLTFGMGASTQAPVSYTHLDVYKRQTPDFTHGRIRRIGDLYRIESDNKIQGIAPGQYGVVYDKDHRLCLGSGMIIDEEK